MRIDKALISACSQNDSKSLYQLYKSWYSPLMSILIRYESDKESVKELINDCFMHIVDNLKQLEQLEEEAIVIWIKTVAVRKGISKHRKTKFDKENVKYIDFQDENGEDSFQNDFSFTYNEAENKLSVEELEKTINKLPDDLCLVFKLYVIDGFAHKEVAEILGITEGTSRSYLSIARKMLKKMVLQQMNQKITIL